jgi:hypothetical protein
MRAYDISVAVPNLPLESDDWIELCRALNEAQPGLGDVGTWAGSTFVAMFMVDAEDEAHAAKIAADAVSDALRATELGDRYPTEILVERTTETLEPAA